MNAKKKTSCKTSRKNCQELSGVESELMELMKRHSCYAPQHRRKKEERESEREKEIKLWSGEEGLQSALPL